jgi:hypothetical protein
MRRVGRRMVGCVRRIDCTEEGTFGPALVGEDAVAEAGCVFGPAVVVGVGGEASVIAL